MLTNLEEKQCHRQWVPNNTAATTMPSSPWSLSQGSHLFMGESKTLGTQVCPAMCWTDMDYVIKEIERNDVRHLFALAFGTLHDVKGFENTKQT